MNNDEDKLGAGEPHDVGGLINEAQELIGLIRGVQVRNIERTFGHPIAHLVAHPEIVEAFAPDLDADSRCYALMFLTYYTAWPGPRARLIAALQADPDPSVRCCAASLIGEMFGNTGDRELLGQIKDVARDEREAHEVRKTAYLAVTEFDRDDNLIDTDRFDFPADADWEFFDRVIPLHDSADARSESTGHQFIPKSCFGYLTSQGNGIEQSRGDPETN